VYTIPYTQEPVNWDVGKAESVSIVDVHGVVEVFSSALYNATRLRCSGIQLNHVPCGIVIVVEAVCVRGLHDCLTGREDIVCPKVGLTHLCRI
jgi:hypothetical protein